MKISDIEALARILREQDLSVLDVHEGEAHVHMERSVPPPTAPPRRAQHRARAVSFMPTRFFFTGFISCTGCWGPF